jgi:hypothetical protein
MIWAGWNNSGTGYGFSVDPVDFDPGWTAVTLELPTRFGLVLVNANVRSRRLGRSALT